MVKPYSEFFVWHNLKIRSFVEINEEDLIWHVDKKSRLCVVLYGSGWKYQLDNKLPVNISAGDTFVIPKELYHRVIKGSSSLILLIKEFDHEPSYESNQWSFEKDGKANFDVYSVS